jgi:hypothetical protein
MPSRSTITQADLDAHEERLSVSLAAQLQRSEVPGVTRLLARDLRPGDTVLSDVGVEVGTVLSTRPARVRGHLIMSWRDGCATTTRGLAVLRVRRGAP